MDQLLENEERFQEAAQPALKTLLCTESFTHRIGSKIVANPNVYSQINNLIESFIATSAKRNPKVNFKTMLHEQCTIHNPDMVPIPTPNTNPTNIETKTQPLAGANETSTVSQNQHNKQVPHETPQIPVNESEAPANTSTPKMRNNESSQRNRRRRDSYDDSDSDYDSGGNTFKID